jgi:tetratricopeptide (TPR) repeat protein
MSAQGGSPTRTNTAKGSGFRRFALQYLVSPILVAAIGFYFNMRLQDAKAELEKSRQQLDRIEVAHEIIQNALSSDYDQCFITLRLVEVVLEPDLAAQVIDGVTEYLGRKAGRELAEGRPEEAVAIVKAAEATGGEAGRKVEEGILRATLAPEVPERLSRAQQAEDYTSTGFRYLVSGRYQDAIEVFQKAEEIYPGYGSAAEIVQLLRVSLSGMADPEIERRVIREIIERFSWTGQKANVQDLQQRAQRLIPLQQRETTPPGP